MTKTIWGSARIEVDDIDPSDVVLMVNGEFAGNVGARVQQVGVAFDIDKEFAHEMARRWNLVASLKGADK